MDNINELNFKNFEKMIKVQIDQVGDVSYYIASKCEFSHVDGSIEFTTYKLVQSEGKADVWVKSPSELPRMLVDNATKIPVVDTSGNPVMTTEKQITGYVKINVGEPIGTDENGNSIYDQVSDYGQPIYADVSIQAVIGEYDMILAMFLYQIPPISIADMIELAIRRRLGQSTTPYVFVEP